MVPTPEELKKAEDEKKKQESQAGESGSTNDPVADALQKKLDEQAKEIEQLKALIPKKKDEKQEAPANDAPPSWAQELIEANKEDMVEKLLKGASEEQLKTARALIKGKGLAASKELLLGMAAMVPKPQPGNGVPVTSTGGVKAPNYFEKGYKHEYAKLPNMK